MVQGIGKLNILTTSLRAVSYRKSSPSILGYLSVGYLLFVPILVPMLVPHKAVADQCVSSGCSNPNDNAFVPFDEIWQAAQNLDWQPQPSAYVCQGTYAPQVYQAPTTYFNDVYVNNSTYVSANSVTSQANSTSRFNGDVSFYQSDRNLHGRELIIDQNSQIASFPQKVIYRSDSMLVAAQNAQFRTDENKGSFSEAEFVIHNSQLRGQAEKLDQESKTFITAQDAKISFCPPGQNDWQLRTQKVEFDHVSGWGYAKHVRLEVLDVPVLYLPFLTFPIDDRRQSGFLYPSFSFSEEGGLNLNIPYYFNLAENYDDTLTPRLIAEYGVLLENEFRYMNASSYSTIETSFLPNDSKTDRNRWLLSVDAFKRHGRWSTSLYYNRISDNNYFTDLDSELSINQESHLSQRLDVNYDTEQWRWSTRLHTYQTIDNSTQPYSKLPQIQLRSKTDPTGLTPSYFFELVSFDRDIEGLSGQGAITGQRFHAKSEIGQEFRKSWGYLKPKASLWVTQYNLKNSLSTDSTPAVAAPIFSMDSGIYLDRPLDDGGTHTLEPRLFVLYVPYTSQNDLPDFDTSLFGFSYSNLFRENRFSGRDRVGDAQQISVGVTQRYINKDGIEAANLSIGQAYLIKDQKVISEGGDDVYTDRTDVAAQASLRASSSVYINVDQIFDEHNLQPTTTNLSLSHRKSLNQRIDFSYRYEQDERDQSTVSFLYPMSPAWTSFGRWQRDWEDSSDVESTLGVEYASCCWSVQLSARRWLTNSDKFNSGFFLKFQLKGLGAAGSSTDFLNDIAGFEQRNDYYGF